MESNKLDQELNTAHYQLYANLPSTSLNLICKWGRIKKKFNPTFNNPVTIKIENCESDIKLWKEEDQWCLKVLEKKDGTK